MVIDSVIYGAPCVRKDIASLPMSAAELELLRADGFREFLSSANTPIESFAYLLEQAKKAGTEDVTDVILCTESSEGWADGERPSPGHPSKERELERRDRVLRVLARLGYRQARLHLVSHSGCASFASALSLVQHQPRARTALLVFIDTFYTDEERVHRDTHSQAPYAIASDSAFCVRCTPDATDVSSGWRVLSNEVACDHTLVPRAQGYPGGKIGHFSALAKLYRRAAELASPDLLDDGPPVLSNYTKQFSMLSLSALGLAAHPAYSTPTKNRQAHCVGVDVIMNLIEYGTMQPEAERALLLGTSPFSIGLTCVERASRAT